MELSQEVADLKGIKSMSWINEMILSHFPQSQTWSMR